MSNKLDTYLADFLPAGTRRKIYSAAFFLGAILTAVYPIVIESVSSYGWGNLAVNLLAAVITAMGALARANTDTDEDETFDGGGH